MHSPLNIKVVTISLFLQRGKAVRHAGFCLFSGMPYGAQQYNLFFIVSVCALLCVHVKGLFEEPFSTFCQTWASASLTLFRLCMCNGSQIYRHCLNCNESALKFTGEVDFMLLH